MKVIIEFGYAKYLFPVEVIPLLGHVKEVEQKIVGGKNKYFIKDSEQEIKINLVNEGRIVSPDSTTAQDNYRQMYEEQEKQNSQLYSRIWAEEKKVSELAAKNKALQELCPDSHKKEDVADDKT